MPKNLGFSEKRLDFQAFKKSGLEPVARAKISAVFRGFFIFSDFTQISTLMCVFVAESGEKQHIIYLFLDKNYIFVHQ